MVLGAKGERFTGVVFTFTISRIIRLLKKKKPTGETLTLKEIAFKVYGDKQYHRKVLYHIQQLEKKKIVSKKKRGRKNIYIVDRDALKIALEVLEGERNTGDLNREPKLLWNPHSFKVTYQVTVIGNLPYQKWDFNKQNGGYCNKCEDHTIIFFPSTKNFHIYVKLPIVEGESWEKINVKGITQANMLALQYAKNYDMIFDLENPDIKKHFGNEGDPFAKTLVRDGIKYINRNTGIEIHDSMRVEGDAEFIAPKGHEYSQEKNLSNYEWNIQNAESVREIVDIFPELVKQIAYVSENQVVFAKNQESHIGAVNTMSDAAKENKQAVRENTLVNKKIESTLDRLVSVIESKETPTEPIKRKVSKEDFITDRLGKCTW